MKIAICGTHCSGKSTLVDYISKELNIPKIKEVAGRFTEEERQNFATQLDILQEQINEERTHVEFVSDRSVVDNCAYIYYHASKLGLESVYNEAKKFVNNYLSKKPYDAIFFVDEYFPLVDNGVRNLDKHQQEYVFNYLKNNIDGISNQYDIPIIHISGNTKKRMEVIKKWLTSQTPQTPQ